MGNGSGVILSMMGQSTIIADLLAGHRRLLTYIRNRIRNPADAEDVYQETMVRMLERARSGGLQQPVPYALRVAHSVILDRAAIPVSDLLDEDIACDQPGAEQRLSDRQRLAAFKRALDAMPPLRREVFTRKRIQGQSREEIAQALGMNEEAVKKHLTRALAQLARSLEEQDCDGPQAGTARRVAR